MHNLSHGFYFVVERKQSYRVCLHGGRRNVSQHMRIALGTLAAPAVVSACVAFVFLSPALTGNQTLNYRYDEKGSSAST